MCVLTYVCVCVCRRKKQNCTVFCVSFFVLFYLWLFPLWFFFFKRSSTSCERNLFSPEENYPVVKYGLQDERNISPNISPFLRDFFASYLDCWKKIFTVSFAVTFHSWLKSAYYEILSALSWNVNLHCGSCTILPKSITVWLNLKAVFQVD